MPPATDLCETCAQIPLDEVEHGELDTSTGFRWSLGPLHRIQSSKCPFCRLVSKAIRCSRRTDTPTAGKAISPHDEVKLGWSQTMVPGLRSAFVIREARGVSLASGFHRTAAASFKNAHMLPKLSAELDVGRVSRWLDHCTDSHDCVVSPHQISFSNAFPGLRVLRFVDVLRNCLVEKQEPVRFVALSYVWGSVANFRLTKANRPELMRLGALQRVGTRLPKTIRNAITLVQSLSLRYLWVDSLCLLQNDPADLEQGVGVMDQIYEHAWLTIIAAYGHDANAGLPGIESTYREPRALLDKITSRTSFGILMDPELRLKKAFYETRAWTFQEQFLSRRQLYFFDNEVTFRCRRGECLETCRDVAEPKIRDYSISSCLWYSLALAYPLMDYSNILFYYTSRALTNQSDALGAMAGILRRLSDKLGYRMLEGLPTGAFDQFVLFSSVNTRRRHGFPSYSWAGWIGQVDMPAETSDELNLWLQDRTWIIWYRRSPSGVLNLVWSLDANPSFPVSNLDIPGYRRRSRFQCPMPGINTSRTMPAEEPLILADSLPPYPLLQFYTMVVFLKLGSLDVFAQKANLVGRDDVGYGNVTLDGFEGTSFFESEDPIEVLLLSEAIGREGFASGTNSWGFYNVMIVEWHKGLAERRGIGLLRKEAIHKSFQPGPQWKEIVLG